MKDFDFREDEREEEPKSRKHRKESECGSIKITAEKVFIDINCKEKKEKKEC